MKLSFHAQAWEDYLWWQQNDKQMLKRLNALIREIVREPFAGIGKPEALKHTLQGFWSRRLSDEHRIVYQVQSEGLQGKVLVIAQCRGHYN